MATCDARSVRWPSYFVGEGFRLLECGAFDVGELPWHFQNGQSTLPPPPLQLCQHQGHEDMNVKYRAARLEARQKFNRYWVELAAPDGRPYFYDFVSHSWTFDRPKALSESIFDGRCEPYSSMRPKAMEGRDQVSTCNASFGISMLDLGRRLKQCLHGPLLQPLPGEKLSCPYCNKKFATEDSGQQHLEAKSGVDGHPVTPAAENWVYKATPAVDDARQSVRGPNLAAVAAVHSVDDARRRREPNLEHPELDVVPVSSPDGKHYFCNFLTQCSYWDRKGGETETREFYAGLYAASTQDGRPFWVRGQLSAFTLQDLCEQFKAQPAVSK
eukprot:TRINITY_DN110362_c0_g1_i1.p1 TRINITY_DN110362_c0_g1~~TRINITY_DN110362_c0_g1_i1.p1  ORF type:complete len:328 (-),score=57.07 TRINITY_DN110362_c0_g1_i1:339-1322(-)